MVPSFCWAGSLLGENTLTFDIARTILTVHCSLTLGLMGLDELHLRVLSASSDDPVEKKNAKKVLALMQKGRHWVLVVRTALFLVRFRIKCHVFRYFSLETSCVFPPNSNAAEIEGKPTDHQRESSHFP